MKHLTKIISENLFLLLKKSHFPSLEYPVCYGDVIDWLYDNNIYPIITVNENSGKLWYYGRVKVYRERCNDITVWNRGDIAFDTIDDCIEACVVEAIKYC